MLSCHMLLVVGANICIIMRHINKKCGSCLFLTVCPFRAMLDVLGSSTFLLSCAADYPGVEDNCYQPFILRFLPFVTILVNKICFQVQSRHRSLVPSMTDGTCSVRTACDTSVPTLSCSSEGGFSPASYSKPYIMFSAADAASAAIDFCRDGVDDGVVDSPPSRGPGRTPACSPSPLRHVTSTPLRDRSCSPTPKTHGTPHRRLYSCDVVRGALGPTMVAPSAAVGEYARVEGNLRDSAAAVTALVDGRSASVVERQYPRLEDNLRLPSVPDSQAVACSRGRASRPRSASRTCASTPSHSQRPGYTDTPYARERKNRKPPTGCTRSLSSTHVSQLNGLNRETPEVTKGVSIYPPVGLTYSIPTYSRREDIMRGMAKLRAQEAAAKLKGEVVDVKGKAPEIVQGFTVDESSTKLKAQDGMLIRHARETTRGATILPSVGLVYSRPTPSRRSDIMKGMAKLKAQEAAAKLKTQEDAAKANDSAM